MTAVLDQRRSEELTAYLAILSIGAVKVALPQNEIRTLEPVLDLRRSESGPVVGSVDLDEGSWPIFALSEDLLPLDDLPGTRRVCVLLGQDETVFGIACDKVASIPTEQVRIIPAPEAVICRGSPVVSLAIHGEEVLCLSTTQALMRLLRGCGCLAAPAHVELPAFDTWDN